MTPAPHRSPDDAGPLDRLLALIDEHGAGAGIAPAARADARATAEALLATPLSPGAPGETTPDGARGTEGARGYARLAYAAELLSGGAVDLAAHPGQTRRLIAALETRGGLPRAALGRELLRSARLMELPVEVAIEVQLTLLAVLSGARSVSLWTSAADGEPRHVAHAGQLDRRAPAVIAGARAVLAGARAMLAGAPRPDHDPASASPGDAIIGLRLEALRGAPAALLAHGAAPSDPLTGGLLPAAAPILAALLDRDSLLAGEHSQDSVAGAVERRLARLRFDLHDGPQQDVHLLAQDLQLFRDQLRPLIAGHPDERRVAGRLDDLQAQLVALDGDLRRLSTSVQSSLLTPGSLPAAVGELAAAFAARTGVDPRVDVSDLQAPLTDSQQIALLSLIREALSNVRKHSDARAVTITIGSGDDGAHVEVRDDGPGFDPEVTLVRAARAGRLGLVGMHERVRMLGGRTQIDSRPGGPTVISATLPRWPAEG